MSTIQYFFIIVLILLGYRTVVKWRSRDLRFSEFIFWMALWTAVAIVVVYPKTSTLVANLLGVGRGADLVIYSSLLLIFYLLFRIFMRLKKQDTQITKLVIDSALKENNNHDSKGSN